MSERLHRQSLPQFHLRSEYDIDRSGALCEPAVGALEDLLRHREVLISYSADSDKVRRQLALLYVLDPRFSHDDGLEVEDSIEYQVRRQPLLTELDVTIEEYRRGPLQQMASLTIKEFIDESQSPFFTEYNFETFKGGSVQSLLTTNNIDQGIGLHAEPMTAYDFKNMLYRVEETAQIIQNVAEADKLDKIRRGL